MRRLRYAPLILVLLLIGGVWYAGPLLRIGAGYAAKMACSCGHLQGRSLADVQESDLNFSVLPYLRLRATETGVTAAFPLGFFRREAVVVPGHGCVLISDETRDLPAALDRTTAARDTLLDWPDRFVGTQPDRLPPGVDTAALRRALDFGFQPLPGGGARGIVVVYRDQLVAERYAPGFDHTTPQLGWSMTKTLTNAAIGLLVKQGKIAVAEDHLFPAWENDTRRDIAVADLLRMNSGLAWNEAYGTSSDATTMLYLRPDMPAYAREQPAAAPPGTTWAYSSGTTNILSGLIRRRLGDDAAYYNLLWDSVFAPIGVTSARIEPDQAGHWIGSSYGWLTPRDWARCGLLYLHDGMWGDRRILPQGWVDYSRQPAAGSDGEYGAHLWLKGSSLPGVPDDTYNFRGFQDQRVFVIPSRDCVIVRLGQNRDQSADFAGFLRQVLSALPAS